MRRAGRFLLLLLAVVLIFLIFRDGETDPRSVAVPASDLRFPGPNVTSRAWSAPDIVLRSRRQEISKVFSGRTREAIRNLDRYPDPS